MKSKLFLILMIFGLLGCDDFLDEAPEDFVTPQGFFKNEAQFNEAVTAIYNTNRGLMNGAHWRFGENRGDNSSFQYNPNDRGGRPNEEVDNFLLLAANTNISSYWNSAYSGIARANFALENLAAIEFLDASEPEIRTGEILFLRSWFYFNLVQLYGDVPLVLSAGNTPDEILSDEFLQRSPAAEVYAKILDDMDTAIAVLPNKDGTESGRATKGAALMLKAKMHMVLQEFGTARDLLEQMQGYSLQTSYASIFDPENKNNDEMVFEIQYSFALGQGSDFVTRFVPFNSGTDILGENGPANSRGGQNQPTQNLIDLYNPADARLLHNVSFYDDGFAIQPWMSKFNFGFVAQGSNAQDVNFPMFRYADALLMLAECYQEVGGGNPVPLIEQVRGRSLEDGTLSAAEQADLEQTIADERRRELAFENHRWFDLVRTGKAVDVMTAHGVAQKAQKSTIPAEAFTNIRTILGIPLGQVEEFGFTQNEGW